MTSRQRVDALHPVSGPPQVKCILLQVLRGLQYLHRSFIIHRWAGRPGGREGVSEGGREWARNSRRAPVSHSEIYSREEQTSTRNL